METKSIEYACGVAEALGFAAARGHSGTDPTKDSFFKANAEGRSAEEIMAMVSAWHVGHQKGQIEVAKRLQKLAMKEGTSDGS